MSLVQDPCIACGKQVRPRQESVECDWCRRWQHRTCGTGISRHAYREASKQGWLTYVCKPCIEKEPTDEGPPVLELSVPTTESSSADVTLEHTDDHDGPPELELSVPTTELSSEDVTLEHTDDHDGPPELELSVPLPSTAVNQTYIIADWEPIADSTTVDDSFSREGDLVQSFDISDEEDNGGPSFDISDREVEEVVPIPETSYQDPLTDTIVEDQGVTFTMIDGASQKGGRILVSSVGYAYGVKRENKSSTIWRCNSRSKKVKCPVLICQKGDNFIQKNEHIHAAVPDREIRTLIYAKVRQSSREEIFKPAMTIAEEAVLQHHQPQNTARVRKALLKRTANRARAALRPEEPKTLDFDLNSDFINADDFLVADIKEDGQRHFVFATEYQLNLLRGAKRWFMDGTFKVLGEPFKRQGQLMSIHAFVEKNGECKQLPLVFCLMSRRTKADYVMVLRSLVERLGDTDVEGFVLDFEQAAWQAVRDVFPGVQVKGCAFHWSQAVWRHVQSVGLAETYRKRIGVHIFIRMLLAIQFLPAAHIPRTVSYLAEKATTETTRALVTYITRQWLNNTTFRVDDWSVYRQTIRTNNDVEGWHHRVNGKAGGNSLGFYRLVPLLRREADLVKISVETGDLSRHSSSRSTRHEAALQRLWDAYSARDIKTSRFLSRVGDIYSVRM